MVTKTATRPPPHSAHSLRPPSKNSSTPLSPSMRVAASVGQNYPPNVLPFLQTPSQYTDVRTPSPNYFGLDPTPDPRNSQFSPPTSSILSFGASTPTPVNANPEFEAFRKQTETGNGFSLSHGSLSHFSSTPGTAPMVPKMSMDGSRAEKKSSTISNGSGSHPRGERDASVEKMDKSSGKRSTNEPSFFDIPRQQSPASMLPLNAALSHIDERHPRLSLPQHRPVPSSPVSILQKRTQQGRADSLPSSLEDGPSMITPAQLKSMLDSLPPTQILLLDLRVFAQFSISRISNALNLCIPTTLLKRPSYNLQKLTDTFSDESERKRFSQWAKAKSIVVYDAHSSERKDALSAVNTLKKFASEDGWNGKGYILRGGFLQFSKDYPNLIDNRSRQEMQSSKTSLTLGTALTRPGAVPVMGGLNMPAAKNASNAFFSNIRQNQDLIGGVGQLSIKLPDHFNASSSALPSWLMTATAKEDHGKKVADKFLQIEKDEQKRMNKALSNGVTYGAPGLDSTDIQIAGVEKGSKNRYNNIWPYEHARVRLQGCSNGSCDYVNASHVKASRSNKRYIASQGPLPATFKDFWSVIWDQDVRVIVMLTAEKEGGQLKCHSYWSTQTYAEFELTLVKEKKVSLDPTRHRVPADRRNSGRMNDVQRSRASTTVGETPPPVIAADPPHVIVRTLSLKNLKHPFTPMRQITQIHYSSWPDFGAPASPGQLLHLVELSNREQQQATGKSTSQLREPENDHNVRPMLVHCSAGCGRTGTFCTVDSVIDMLKRQKKEIKSGVTPMDISGNDGDYMGKGKRADSVEGEWVFDGETDLVEATVEDFRSQRLSMVQSLRQYVLCYETVLEWMAQEHRQQDAPRTNRERSGSDGAVVQKGSM